MNGRVYYNEIDHFAAAWLAELMRDGLIPAGEIDTRSIVDVRGNDLAGFEQCHFFAGIGGWAYALELAQWEGPVWTGSCPCQPFSAAGKRKGIEDERHLWPVWFGLIRQRRPERIFGEQVEGAIGLGWLDEISADMEAENYAVGAAVLGAHSVRAPHIRQRLYWVADATGNGRKGVQPGAVPQISQDGTPETLAAWNATGDPFTNWKEQLAEARICSLAHGVSSRLVRRQLRGAGNAIVPQVAAEFIKAFL